MRSLRELQEAFAKGVLQNTPDAVGSSIHADGFVDGQRLQIYRNNVFISLAEALATAYPVVHALVGDEFFRYVAHGYIRQFPPTAGSLHSFGGQLSEFLSTHAQAAALAYLSDVARLEWARQEAYHAATCPALDRARLSTVPVEQYPNLVFDLHPSCRLIDSSYPVLRIWEVNQANHEGDGTVSLDEGPCRVLVCRPGDRVRMVRLKPGAFCFLERLSVGEMFAAACDAAVSEEPVFDLNRAFQQLVVDGIVVDFRLHRDANREIGH